MNRDKVAWMAIAGFLLVSGSVIAFLAATEKRPTQAEPPAKAAVQAPDHLKTLPQSARADTKVKANPTTTDRPRPSKTSRDRKIETPKLTQETEPVIATADPAPTQKPPPTEALKRDKPESEYIQTRKEHPEVDLGLLHFARSGTALEHSDYDNFAGILSYEYRAEANPSKKQALLESMKRDMDDKVQAFKTNPYFVIQLPFYLGGYDTANKAFPLIAGQLYTNLSWLKDGRLPYFANTSNFTVRIRNADQFSRYSVSDEEKIEDLNSLGPKQRDGIATVFLFARNASGNGSSRTIGAEIAKVKLNSGDGEFLGELGF